MRNTFTPRQRTLLACICRHGMSIGEAGPAVGITPGTARTHLARVYERLGISGIGPACYRYRETVTDQSPPPPGVGMRPNDV